MAKIKPISLYQLIKKKGYETLGEFREYFLKITGERLPSSTLSNYQYQDKTRPGDRRLEDIERVLELSLWEKKRLRAFFKEHEKKLRNVGPHKVHTVNKSGSKKINRKPHTERTFKVKKVKQTSITKKISKVKPGIDEAGNYLILCKELAPRLGKNFERPEVKTAIFTLSFYM